MLPALSVALAPIVLAAGAAGISTDFASTRSQDAPPRLRVTFDEEDDPITTSMRETSARLVTLGNGTHCLNFLHIPKTGGSSIEEVGKSKPDDSLDSVDAKQWGIRDLSLSCKGLGECPFQGHSRCCPMTDGSRCSVWHVPPADDKILEKTYQRCETFCVVRDPVARFRSEHAYHRRPCTTQALGEAVNKTLRSLGATPAQADCHFIPQSRYHQNGRTCQHVMKQENFKEDFLALLAKFGISADIEMAHKFHTGCAALFDRESLDKLHEYYSADYAAFGYKKDYLMR